MFSPIAILNICPQLLHFIVFVLKWMLPPLIESIFPLIIKSAILLLACSISLEKVDRDISISSAASAWLKLS